MDNIGKCMSSLYCACEDAVRSSRLVASITVTLACTGLFACGVQDDTDSADEVSEVVSASTVGGSIARAEVLTRAQRWVDLGVMYSQDQSNAFGDGDGHSYRPDCSGFVSMVWHLPKKSDGWDLNTGDFGAYSGKTNIAYDDLAAGDAILGVAFGHIALFDRWTDSSRTDMWIYQENQTGTPANHVTRSRSWYIANDFQPIRYRQIVDAAAAGNGVVSGDVTGDGRSDMIARTPDGKLSLYTNGGSNTAPYATGILIGTSWQSFRWFLAGDVTGDGRADLVAAGSDGNLTLYTNGGSNTAPYATGILIGTAWQQFTRIMAGDVTGDGRADLVAIKPDGTLWLYTNGGSNTAPYATGVLIGTSWQNFRSVSLADVTGDGRADLVAVGSNGTLTLYTNGGSNTAPYATGILIGTGWQNFN